MMLRFSKQVAVGLTHGPEVPCTILRTLKYSRVAHRIFTLPEIMVRDVNLSINVGLFFFPPEESCIFKTVFLLQSGKHPQVFFHSQKSLQPFLTTSACVKWQARWKSLGRQRWEGTGKWSPPPPLRCQANLFSSFCKGNHKRILPAPNS